jgi:hypothetical protein
LQPFSFPTKTFADITHHFALFCFFWFTSDSSSMQACVIIPSIGMVIVILSGCMDIYDKINSEILLLRYVMCATEFFDIGG